VNWSDWFAQRGSSVAWLTIDSDDNEPSRFLFYVVQAFGALHPKSEQMRLIWSGRLF
jgi:ATP/maltotriose-dependent transcriptional regulator MalT